jgi:outer membrane protein
MNAMIPMTSMKPEHQAARRAAPGATRSAALLAAATSLAALLAPLHAQAQGLGTVTLRAGIVNVVPETTSGNLSAPSLPGTKIDLGDALQFGGGVNVALSDRFSIDLPLSMRLRLDINGDGAIAGVGKLGDVQAVPTTLLLQYRFGNAGAMRPFIGLGWTRASFGKTRTTAALTALLGGTPARPVTLSLDDSDGAALQFGVSVPVATRWSVEVSMIRASLKTTARMSSGQTIGLRLEPVAFSAALGWQF